MVVVICPAFISLIMSAFSGYATYRCSERRDSSESIKGNDRQGYRYSKVNKRKGKLLIGL